MFKKLESGVIINVNLIEVIEKDYEGQQRAKINKGSYILTERDIEEIMNPWTNNPFISGKSVLGMFGIEEQNEKED